VAANHEYDGADNGVSGLQDAHGAKCNNCRSCGSPMDGSAEVNRVADRSSAAPKPAQVAPKKSKLPWIIGGDRGAGGVLPGGDVLDEGRRRHRHGAHWERTIDVERMTAVNESAWCDGMPSGRVLGEPLA